MAKAETDIVHGIQMDVSPLGARLIKNVRGVFLTLDKLHKVRAGLLAPGASDLIGFVPVKVTQAMVGTTVAIFCAVEVKTQTGTVSREQNNFIDVVQKSGGFAGVARSKEDARKIMQIPA